MIPSAAAAAAAANGYELMQRIGGGAYGEVFLAKAPASSEVDAALCCIKRVPVSGVFYDAVCSQREKLTFLALQACPPYRRNACLSSKRFFHFLPLQASLWLGMTSSV
jgi:hypothetical protein